MKCTLKRYFWFLALVPFMLLTACEGGGGGGVGVSSSPVSVETPSRTPQPPAAVLIGTVADGYLSGARVFLDRNGNRVYDNGEPMAVSLAGGAFSLSINPGEGARYSVVAEVIAGKTIDEDTGQPVLDSYLLEAPAGFWQFVSPLTTLVNLEMQKNPTMTLQRAELNVKNRLGIADEISLFTDYLAPSADQVTEARRTHKAAQVVASLMGTLRNEIATNVGGQITDDLQQMVGYLVSDEIMRRSSNIAEVLNAERNTSQVTNVANLASAISGQIDASRLDQAKLQRYEERIAQRLEIWDMEPPQILQQNVADGEVVSVDSLLMVVFDKEIDPATISSNAILLQRSGSYISGVIDYDAELKRLRFTPAQMLLPDSRYEVIVSGQLADPLGNEIGTDLTWQFSTLFDLTPPDLVDLDTVQNGL